MPVDPAFARFDMARLYDAFNHHGEDGDFYENFTKTPCHVLDIGCGYGPIALTLARRAPLATVYAVEVNDPNTAILLQHRALLFGVLGVLMLSAIALPGLRVTALTVALVSAASFILSITAWVPTSEWRTANARKRENASTSRAGSTR